MAKYSDKPSIYTLNHYLGTESSPGFPVVNGEDCQKHNSCEFHPLLISDCQLKKAFGTLYRKNSTKPIYGTGTCEVVPHLKYWILN